MKFTDKIFEIDPCVMKTRDLYTITFEDDSVLIVNIENLLKFIPKIKEGGYNVKEVTLNQQ